MARKITDPMEAALAFQRGDEAGFEYFYNELWGALAFYANRFLEDKEGAMDAVEFAFIRIWEITRNNQQTECKPRDTFYHPKVIKKWLYTSVKFRCLNLISAIKSNEEKKEQLTYLLQNETEESIDHNIIRAETINYARNLIEKLPEECKKIFLLMYVEGLSAAQIAKHLKLNISTVKNQKMRGLKILSDWVILGKSPASLLKENTKTKFLVISSLRERGVPFKIIGYKLNMSSSSVASIYRRGQQGL